MTRFILLAFMLLLTLSAARADERKILYYRNPMGLPDTSQAPKKDQMGMDYIPVYADEGNQSPGTVVLSPEKIQRIGVRSEAVSRRVFSRQVKASGVAAFDESKLFAVSPRFSGWVEKLYVNTTGQTVRKGEPLMDVYSPELIDAERDFLVARKLQKGENGNLKPTLDRQVTGALTRLGYFGFSKSDQDKLEKDGKILKSITIYAPASGVTLEKNIVDGASFDAGAMLYRFVDTSSLWVDTSVAENDIGRIKEKDPVSIRFKAYPDRSFDGIVHHIHPELDPATRTGTVKVLLANPQGLIRTGMYAEVDIATSAGLDTDKLSVPLSAIIDSGEGQMVIVDLGDGRFAPRPVKIGVRAADYVEILEGLAEGDKIVTRANFLIDAESNLKAAFESFNDGGRP